MAADRRLGVPPRRRRPRRAGGCRQPLDVGPPARIVGPWEQPIFEGWSVLAGLVAGDQPRRARADGRSQHVPQPRAHREAGDHARPPERRPRDPRHRRRLVRARARGVRHRLRVRARASGSTASTSPWCCCGACSTASGSRPRRRRATGCTTRWSSRGRSRRHLPIMIGGSGPKKTLRTLARYGDAVEHVGRTARGARRRRTTCCASACAERRPRPARRSRRRSPSTSSSATTRAAALRRLDGRPRGQRPVTTTRRGPTHVGDARRRSPTPCGRSIDLGFRHVLVDMPAPYDAETIDRIGEVARAPPRRVTRSSRWPAASAAPSSPTGLAGAPRRGPDRRRQHRRRRSASRAARDARPRHGPVHPRRHRREASGAGASRARPGPRWTSSGVYGEDPWFRLGDRDLATHLVRTAGSGAGDRLDRRLPGPPARARDRAAGSCR